MVLFNIASTDETLRNASLRLLQEINQTFKLNIPSGQFDRGPHLPVSSTNLPAQYSQAFAQSAPQLTLEFLKEWIVGFGRASLAQKTASLIWVTPWLSHLQTFAVPNEMGVDHMRQARDIVKSLIALTAGERHVSARRGPHQASLICAGIGLCRAGARLDSPSENRRSFGRDCHYRIDRHGDRCRSRLGQGRKCRRDPCYGVEHSNERQGHR